MALPGGANCINEWSVPNQLGMPTGKDAVRCAHRILRAVAPVPAS